jgi:hypothetical protein
VGTVVQRRRTSARFSTLWPQMATLDSLPGDQRAVLQLVLGRGRSYDEIAGLLTIDREAVRARALAALDALGPQTRVAGPDRQMICDYLLGQLPDADVSVVRERLAHGAAERAWARVLSAELAPVASGPLPEIPSEADPAAPEPVALAAPAPAADDEPTPAPAGNTAEAGDTAEAAEAAAEQPPPPLSAGAAPEATKPPRRGRRKKGEKPAQPEAGDGGRPRSSRRGGIVVIALAAIIVVVVVLLLVLPGSSKKPSSTAAAPATTTSTAATATAPATGTTPATGTATTPATGTSTAGATGTASTPATGASGTAQPKVQINLTPTQTGSKAEGIADVLNEGSQRELAIVAQGLPPNTAKNSYEVWLYNSPTDAKSIGFGPVVGANGKLAAAGPLPTDASHFKQLIVTLETTSSPKTPGPIVMQGQVTGLS